MSRKYTNEEKRHVLFLVKKHKNAAEVARITGIPARTIRDWREDHNRYRYEYESPLNPRQHPAAAFATDGSTITPEQLRRRVLTQLDALTSQTYDNPRAAYYASLTDNHLLSDLEHLTKLLTTAPPSAASPPDGT